MRIHSSKQGCFLLRPRCRAYIAALCSILAFSWYPMIPKIEMAGEQLYHAFRVIPGMRYRMVVYAEQLVGDRWIEMSSTQLATYSTTNRRNPDPTRPPPPPAAAPAAAAAAEDVVPPTPPEELPQPNRDAPGVMRTPRTSRQDRVAGQRWSPPFRQSPPTRQSPPARQSSPARQSTPARPPARPRRRPLFRRPPLSHPMLVPAWAVVANDIWFTCPMCCESAAHSGFVCGQCRGRPACCECVDTLEASRVTQGRCPFCRYEGSE
jgi:hypothetical protein